MFQKPFVSAAAVKFHNQVAALCPQVGGVRGGVQQNTDVIRTIAFLLVLDEQVAEITVDMMGLLHVGGDVEMSAESDGESVIDESQLQKIGTGNVGTDGTVELLGTEEGIETDTAVEKVVMTCDGGLSATVLEMGLGGHPLQVKMTVLQLLDGGIGSEMTPAGEDIGAVALGLDVSADGIERILRHEVVQVQVAHLDVSIVGHEVCDHLSLGIEGNGGVALQLYRSLAFADGEIGGVSGGIGLERAVETDAVGDTVVVHRLGVE